MFKVQFFSVVTCIIVYLFITSTWVRNKYSFTNLFKYGGIVPKLGLILELFSISL